MSAIDCVADIVRHHAATRPGHPAFRIDGESTTYAELDAASSRVAQALAGGGVGRQDRVAFLDRNTLEYFLLLFGAAKLGAVTVAVNWRLAPSEMRYILEHAGARVLVVGPEFLGHVEQMRLDASVTVLVAGHSTAGSRGFGEWLAAQPAADPGVAGDGQDTCCQLYTSGTTGLPKGVELSEQNVLTALERWSVPWGFDADSRNVVAMPLFHVAGSLWALAGLYAGGTNVLLRAFDPGEMLRVVASERITNALLVPAAMQALLATPGVNGTDFSGIRTLVYGASPIAEDVQRDFFARVTPRMTQVYGLTETTGAATLLTPEDHAAGMQGAGLLRAAGRPGPGVEVRIVDIDAGHDLGEGEVGEVWIRTAQNLKGYWHDEDATAAVYPEGRGADGCGWFRSGDAGYLKQGVLYLHDRVKDMIVSGGENIYPAEIENVLMGHPGVTDVAVIGVPDDRWGETVKALVVVAPGSDPGAGELIEWCRQRLARYKCPTSVDRVNSIPRNPSGKMLKKDLRAPFWAGRTRQVN